MFILHSSNKTENLVAHLVAVLQHAPLQSVFDAELFLIQSQGMERWLSQQLAEAFQVWGNFEFLFPGKFFSHIAQRLNNTEADDAFSRDRLQWRLEALLRELDASEFNLLWHYLSGGSVVLKRFQLAKQLAQLFDQYQIMRPDMLVMWEQDQLLYDNSVEHWQKALWQALLNEQGQLHRGALWLNVIDQLNQADSGEFQAQLPERVSIFGIHSLPPLWLAFLQALARHCDVHLYLLNPAQVYWGDVPGKQLLARLDHFDGHPLLATLGQQGREFQQMLLGQVQFELELDSYEASPVINNLQQLQNDILDNCIEERMLAADDSLRIHSCHSRLREVQVMRAELLAALESDHQLELRHIVVMAPDIQLYAPFIHAVFADIQHAIADRSLNLSNSLLDVFISFLRLTQSRFGWTEVMDLLEQPAVFRRFDLDAEQLDLIRFWGEDLRVRWGRDPQHKEQLNLPPLPENTWQAALGRLFMGYAIIDDDDFIDGILPYPHIEGLSAQALGGLHDFLQLLFQTAELGRREHTLGEWSELLYALSEQLLADTESVERRELNELLLDLRTRYGELHQHPVAIVVIMQWLQDMIAERKSSSGFLRGQLTFCSMLPMRSIPFQVIGLLGMNEGEFPRLDRQPAFDLLQQHFRPGDRSRRADDRYQFLELLLSARQQLIISYIGQSMQDNADIPPSVVISELLDVMMEHYQLTDLLVRHPLHAFSRHYFSAQHPHLFSYEPHHLAIAQKIQLPKPAVKSWWQGQVEAPVNTVIDIAELYAFFRHPQRYFMRQLLGLRFTGIPESAEDREPFYVSGLEDYQINEQWVEAEFNQQSIDVKRLQAQGLWPLAGMGELLFAQREPKIKAFIDTIQQKQLGNPCEAKALDITVGAYRLVGKLDHCYQNGSFLFRYSSLKGKDFILAWLHHNLLNLTQPYVTHLLSKDKDLSFNTDLADSEHLQRLLSIYQQGQQQPYAFFTEASFDYICQANNPKAKIEPLQHTLERMIQRVQQPYEPELRQLFADEQTLLTVFNEAFEQQCQQLLLPIWQAIQPKNIS